MSAVLMGFNSLELLNRCPQSHWNGREPVWIRWCVIKQYFVENVLSQWSQECGFNFKCTPVYVYSNYQTDWISVHKHHTRTAISTVKNYPVQYIYTCHIRRGKVPYSGEVPHVTRGEVPSGRSGTQSWTEPVARAGCSLCILFYALCWLNWRSAVPHE